MVRINFDFENAVYFWQNYKTFLKAKGQNEKSLLLKAKIPQSTIANARARNGFPSVVYVRALAEALDVKMEDFFKDPYQNNKEKQKNSDDFDIVFVLVNHQKIASSPIAGEVPILKRMLKSLPHEKVRALEVSGDSMTGIQLFDGDIVFYVPGEVHGDGLYVIRVMDELFVKRVEFDPINHKLRIMSENPRYPDRIELSDSQTITVVGKVYGWVHAHSF